MQNCRARCRRKCAVNAECASKPIYRLSVIFPEKASRTEENCVFLFPNLLSVRADAHNKMSLRKLHEIDTLSLMSLREADRSRGEKRPVGRNRGTRSQCSLSPRGARECTFPFIYLFFSRLRFFSPPPPTNFRDARRSPGNRGGGEGGGGVGRKGKRRRGEKVVYLHAHSDRSSLLEPWHRAK